MILKQIRNRGSQLRNQ